MASSALLNLPAELRNQIYTELFYSQEQDFIDLCKATPPTSDVLLTCQQICREAAKLHKAACQFYWQNTHFFLDAYHCDATTKARLRRMRLAEIQDLSIHLHMSWFPREGRTVNVETKLRDRRGIWRTDMTSEDEFPTYRALPPYSDGTGREMYFLDYVEAVASIGSFEEPATLDVQVLSLLTWREDFLKVTGAQKVEYVARS